MRIVFVLVAIFCLCAVTPITASADPGFKDGTVETGYVCLYDEDCRSYAGYQVSCHRELTAPVRIKQKTYGRCIRKIKRQF